MRRLIVFLSRSLAALGGVVLVALILLTCVSVIGRVGNTIAHAAVNAGFAAGFFQWAIDAGLGPILGDFELIEIGIAFAIFAFLPWCQVMGGHATVDLFTAALPGRSNRFLAMLWEWTLAAAMILLTWRLYVGMTDKMRYGETTFLLLMPVWWGYAICVAAGVIACAVAIYVAFIRTMELATDRDIVIVEGRAGDGGAHH